MFATRQAHDSLCMMPGQQAVSGRVGRNGPVQGGIHDRAGKSRLLRSTDHNTVLRMVSESGKLTSVVPGARYTRLRPVFLA